MKEKKKSFTGLIIVGTMVLLTIGLLVLYDRTNRDELTRELQKEGYKTETSDDLFFHKIVSNNTLDTYYSDISNKKDSVYEEYYLEKESLNFIELKMLYQQEVSTSLNITSNLKTLETSYNYELTYKDAHLMLEGDETRCDTIIEKNIEESTIETYCKVIEDEIGTYISRRQELLKNTKVQELLTE